MCHNYVDIWEVRNRVLGDGYCVRCTLVGGIVAVLVAEVGKRPVAELGLVRRCVHLLIVSLERIVGAS
jgi:hypothetical protein